LDQNAHEILRSEASKW